MKTNSNKNVKRSISPLVSKTQEISQRKKKSLSHANNPYAKVIKQFQTYGKSQAHSNKKEAVQRYGKQSGVFQRDRDKYRIVTQPVDDRIMHLGKVNIFNSSFGKVPASRKKIQKQADPPVKFNLRSSTRSKQKLNTQQSQYPQDCRNCQRYIEQNQFLKTQLNKIFMTKMLWKNAQITLNQCKCQFGLQLSSGNPNKSGIKTVEGLVLQTKKHILDLMKDVESLSNIDYPKMLSLDIFTYEPSFNSCSDHQYAQIKSLIGQLRSNMEGKITDNDIDDFQNDTRIRSMLRNMKNRLNHVLRENIELRMNKAVLAKADQLSIQSQEYLKRVIQDVLASYSVNQR